MANKRSLVAAVLNATAASDIFTQDIEDMADSGQHDQPVQVSPSSTAAPSPAQPAPAVQIPEGMHRTSYLESLCAQTKSITLARILEQANTTHADFLDPDDFASAVRMLQRNIEKAKAAKK